MGEAQSTETMTIKVYGMPFQHNYVAIHAACKMTGTEFEFVFTNLMDGSNKTPEYLAKFPMHCCPALEDTDNGLCITETNAIMRYIARKAGHALYPEDLKQAAICDMALDHKLCSLGKDIAYTFIYPKVGFAPAVEAEALAAAVEKMKTDQWPAMQKFINESGGPFFCGSQVTIADLSLWGHVKIMAIICPEAGMWECEGIRAWFDAVEGTIEDGWYDGHFDFWNSKK